MKRKLFLITGLLLCISAAVLAQDNASKGIRFHQNESWEKILQLAKEENKMIFMDCYTVWCGPCKALAKDIFPQEKVGDFFNPRFINVQYDMEKGDGKMLYEKYKKNIIGFPTLLLLDKNGNVLQQMAGYQEADQLIEGIKKASSGEDLFTLRKKYQAGERSFEFIKSYLSSLNDAFLKDTIQAVADNYLRQIDLKELDKDEVWQTLGQYITDIHSPAFDFLVRNADRYYYKLHRDRYKINRQLETAINKEIRRITELSYGDDGKAAPLVEDTVMMQKVLQYMSIASLRKINETKARFFIHRLLINQNYTEAWKYIDMCVQMNLSGFYSYHIHDYIKYITSQTTDKKLLKELLLVLEKYKETEHEKDTSFSYHMYKTMSDIYEKLGNKKTARTLLETYQRLDEEKRKEMEEFFK